LTGLHVIIIEDEDILAFCLNDVVEDAGCVVVGVAGWLDEALSLAATATFDVAIVDLQLHGQNAYAVAASIVSRGRAIVVSTGSDASEVPAEFHEWPVLRKPYKDAAILSAIKSATRLLLDRDRKLLLNPR
jgi:DNA-binding NarL/FixJ family response regulator